MALFPCQRHGLHYRGAQSTLYPAVVNGSSSTRWKLRLCFDCAMDLLSKVEEKLTLVDSDGSADVNGTSGEECYECGSHQLLDALFVTAYVRSEEPRQFYGHTCSSCRPAFERMLLYHPR